MQAVILAAGRGNRMRPLTDKTHKTLIEIDGVSLLQRLISGLAATGIERFFIVTGYRAEEVKAHTRQHFPHLALTFIHNEQHQTTNNIVSLAQAFEQLDLMDDVLLAEADVICDVTMLQRLVSAPGEAALIDHYRTGMDGTVVTLSEGRVTGVIPPHLQGADFNFRDKYKTLNIYRFSASFCREAFAGLLRYYAQSIDHNSYYELVLGILIYLGRAQVQAVLVAPHERWVELDDPNDLREAEFVFRQQGSASGDWLGELKGGWWGLDVLDFCYLRNMYWPTTAMLSELRHILPDAIMNYGSSQKVLDEKLRWWLLCQPERAITLAGLSQVFPWLGRYFAGKRVLVPHPTFGEYARAFPEAEYYEDKFALELSALVQHLANFEVCVIVNPNNPTGTEISTSALYDLIARYPHCWFLVDESFQGFSNQPSLIPCLDEKPLPNVMVLASLSKTLGVPGLRLGYVYTCNPEWRVALLRDLPIWNVNSLAENFLEVALKHRQSFEQSLKQTRLDRAEFAAQLRTLPGVSRVIEGGGNFVLVCGRFTNIVERLLQYANMLVKDVSPKIADGRYWLRIAVRLPHENQQLMEALRELL